MDGTCCAVLFPVDYDLGSRATNEVNDSVLSQGRIFSDTPGE